MDRREFLTKTAAGATTLLAASCGDKKTGASASSSSVPGEGTMTYRINPNTGDKVSILGYGCMRWPMKKDENGRDVVDQEQVNTLVDYALEHGVNYFDCAPVYLQGQCEYTTGTALKRHPRASYYIATKLSNFGDPSQEEAKRMYYNSLEQLQTDYIDYYLLHSLNDGTNNFNRRFVDNGMMDFLLEERKAGRVRNLGFSFHGPQEGFDELMALHDKYHWDFVQIQLNYSDWRLASGRNTRAEYLYEELHKRGIPAVIMEPLQGGRLSKVPDNIVARLKAREPEKSVASWAFRFAGTPEGVLTALSGMTYMEHLEDNIKSYSPLVPLTDEECDFLFETAILMQQYPTIPCNDCKYCMPCPYGIDIPSVFVYYNKRVNEVTIPTDRENKNYRKLRKSFLDAYDKAVPALRQADHCIGCRQCVEHCPQDIDIPRQLRRIDEYVEKLKQNTL
ncbi:MAG: aldo/keto reductase [Bacteroidaceae bacterium]|nr:aldo/keto reductase [Bacteroidaceae bacterium]